MKITPYNRFFFSNAISIFMLIFFLLNIFSAYAGLNNSYPPIRKCLFLYPANSTVLSKAESNDLKSLGNSIFVSGLKYDKISVDSISTTLMAGYDLLILPSASAKSLTTKQVSKVKQALVSGINLLFFGTSPLTKELGIALQENPIQISQIRDLQFPDQTLY